MKLLIVDDETLTREGLLHNIDWEALGITAVAQADDGFHGLMVAQSFCPDIVISDVRMPRLSGIQMAERLQARSPDISIIFMSGYSDKQYLKAAIKLKAVSYVEKPIDLKEMKETVREACRNVARARKMAGMQELSISHSRSSLAEQLIAPPRQDEKIPPSGIKLEFDFPTDSQTPFFTFLIQFFHSSAAPSLQDQQLEACISQALAQFHMQEIHSARQEHLFFYHVWGRRAYSDQEKDRLGRRLEQALEPLSLRYHLVFGKNVFGIAEIHNSYNSAVIELQNSFFDRENTHRIYVHKDHYKAFSDLGRLKAEKQLNEYLLHKNRDEARSFLNRLLGDLLADRNILPNQARDLYYNLFAAIREACRSLKLQTDGTQELEEGMWEFISLCDSIYELHSLLEQSLQSFFALAGTAGAENSMIYLMKQFIADNYANESLSIKDISAHVNLSFSYVCTLFKNETGSTLNQYLTEYRINKAKALLEDPRYRIVDISSQVGYSDGNYFGKIFKRSTGMSPSEYREHRGRRTDGTGGDV